MEEQKKMDTPFEAPEKQEVDLIQMNMQDLVTYAEAKGVETYGMGKREILMALGVVGQEGAKAFVRPQLSPERLAYIRSRHMQEPMNTIFPASEYEEWMKVIAKEPLAFMGLDLTDKNLIVQHTLKPRGNKCACGAKIDFPKRDDNPKEYYDYIMCPGTAETVLDHGRRHQVYSCISPGVFRKWILHSIPPDDGK